MTQRKPNGLTQEWLTATEMAAVVSRWYKRKVSREWVRRHCRFARIDLSPRRVFYDRKEVRAVYGR